MYNKTENRTEGIKFRRQIKVSKHHKNISCSGRNGKCLEILIFLPGTKTQLMIQRLIPLNFRSHSQAELNQAELIFKQSYYRKQVNLSIQNFCPEFI